MVAACSDEEDAVDGVAGNAGDPGGGKGGSSSTAGSSTNGGKAGSSTTAGKGGSEEPGGGTGGTESSAGAGNVPGEGGGAGSPDPGMAGMGNDGGMGMGGEPVVSGGTGGGGNGGGGNGGGGNGGGGNGGAGSGGGGTAGTETGGGGTGGTGGCPAAPVLNAFAADADITGWSGVVFKSGFSGPSTTSTSTVTRSTTEGHTAAGALQDVLVLGADGPIVQTSITLDPRADWTCYTKLHMWIKLAYDQADASKLSNIQTYLNPGTSYDFNGGGGFTNVFDDTVNGVWREYVLTLPSATKNDIGRIGVLFQVSAPVNVTMYIDDISLE